MEETWLGSLCVAFSEDVEVDASIDGIIDTGENEKGPIPVLEEELEVTFCKVCVT